jgi:hypothetical protein
MWLYKYSSRRIVFTIQSRSHSEGRRRIYLFGKVLRPTVFYQRHNVDEELLSLYYRWNHKDCTKTIRRGIRWAYGWVCRSLQMNLGFMAMETTSETCCSCSTSHLDEWVSVYIGGIGRCLYVACLIFVVLHVKSSSWSWWHGDSFEKSWCSMPGRSIGVSGCGSSCSWHQGRHGLEREWAHIL